MSVTKKFLNFPRQKLTDRQKTDKWFKECVDFAENLLTTDDYLKQSFKNKNENYDLRSNIIDRRNVEKMINPDKLDLKTMPANFQHIGIENTKIDLLVGEYVKRRKEFRAYLSNGDADGISRKEATLTNLIKKRVAELVQQPGLTEEEIAKQMQRLQKYITYDFQDISEITANKILKREIKEQDLEFEFRRTFEDMLISGESIVYCGVHGGLPKMERVDPRNIYTVGNPSMYLHDSDIIVHYTYKSIGKVMDEYYDFLTDKDVEYLETGDAGSVANALGLNRDISIEERFGPNADIELFNPSEIATRALSGSFDTQGNVRVVKVCWKSRRKIGKLKYYDEYGEEQYDYVPDTYKVDEDAGEEIKWEWVNEWMEGTKIGDEIYVHTRPVPYSSKSIVNKSKGLPPFIGICNATQNNRVQSLTDMLKPLSYSFDIAWYKRELEIATHVGSFAAINAALIPSGWDPEKWMRYAKINKFAFLDPTNEINKGPAQGKSAGHFNTVTASNVQISNFDSVQMFTNYLLDIEDRAGRIAGISGAREGQIQNRETVRGIEREITQTSHITEKWFSLDAVFRKQALTKFLECCKYAYKQNPKRGQYILDDMGMAMVSHFTEFVESDFDIHIANSTSDTELFQNLKDLAHASIQNGNATIGDLVKIMQTESIQEIARKLEDSSKKLQEQQQQQQQEALQSQEKMQQAQLQDKQQERELDKYKIDTDAQVKREEIDQRREAAYLTAQSKERDGIRRYDNDTDDNGIDDRLDLERTKIQAEKNANDKDIKEKQLAETKRHNLATEAISRKSANNKSTSSTK
jgi:hypothetical protein